jgi:hypothetical protein
MIQIRPTRWFRHGYPMVQTYIEALEVPHKGSRGIRFADVRQTAGDSLTTAAAKSCSVVLHRRAGIGANT